MAYYGMHKQQQQQLRRSKKLDPKSSISLIAQTFKISEKRIHIQHLKYYFLNCNICYVPKLINPLLNNIHDYLEPIKQLSHYYGPNSYYTKILKYSDLLIDPTFQRLDLCEHIDPIDKDLIMLEFIRCRPTSFILTFWPFTKNIPTESIVALLSKYGIIHYTKIINLTKKAIFNLMFLMYDEFTITQRLKFIKDKLDYTKIKEGNNNPITFIFFDNIYNHKLAGQGSQAKREIRTELLSMCKKYMNINDNIRGNDLIHINDTFHQTITYAETILNDNSIKLLEFQNIEGVIDPFFMEAHFKIQTFRKWLFENLSPLEQSRVIVMGGVVFYTCGFKKSGDIDAAFVNVSSSVVEEEKLANLINPNFNVKGTKFFFAGMEMEGSEFWRWDQQNKEIFEVANVENLLTISTNPRYHYYFQNLKCYTLGIEIVRKLFRNKYNDYADLLMLSINHSHLVSRYVWFDEKTKMVRYNEPFSEKEWVFDGDCSDVHKLIFEYINKRYLRESVNKMRMIMDAGK